MKRPSIFMLLVAYAGFAAPQEQDSVNNGAKEALLCMSCHRFNGQGSQIAGDLAAMLNHTREALRQGIAQPQPVSHGVLVGRLRGGATVPVIRRPWTGDT